MERVEKLTEIIADDLTKLEGTKKKEIQRQAKTRTGKAKE